jgi:hypothetical protein
MNYTFESIDWVNQFFRKKDNFDAISPYKVKEKKVFQIKKIIIFLIFSSEFFWCQIPWGKH